MIWWEWFNFMYTLHAMKIMLRVRRIGILICRFLTNTFIHGREPENRNPGSFDNHLPMKFLMATESYKF